jgi:hypothetical protein
MRGCRALGSADDGVLVSSTHERRTPVVCAVALAALSSCGPPPSVDVLFKTSYYPQGVPAARVEKILTVATGRWGLTSRDLDGWTITFQDTLCITPCGEAELAGGAGGSATVACTPEAWGYTDPDHKTICCSLSDKVVKTGACLEASALVHEVGHTLYWGHENPAWRDAAAWANSWTDLMDPSPPPGCESEPMKYAGRW